MKTKQGPGGGWTGENGPEWVMSGEQGPEWVVSNRLLSAAERLAITPLARAKGLSDEEAERIYFLALDGRERKLKDIDVAMPAVRREFEIFLDGPAVIAALDRNRRSRWQRIRRFLRLRP